MLLPLLQVGVGFRLLECLVRLKVNCRKMCGELSEPWKFKKCTISSQNGEVIDSGMVVFFQSPHSYTGEDVVDFIVMVIHNSCYGY